MEKKCKNDGKGNDQLLRWTAAQVTWMGGDTVGRTVALDTRVPGFESYYLQLLD